VTGAGIAIFHRGKIEYLKTYGARDAETGSPLTADSVMTSASLSKAAFATVVMRLVQSHILDLDKPIDKYLPKPLPTYSQYVDLQGDDRWKRPTLRILLSHTSGFPNWRAFEDDRRLRIHFEPGTRSAYSGEGIVLAQLVVEAVTGKPIEALDAGGAFHPPENDAHKHGVGAGVRERFRQWLRRIRPFVGTGKAEERKCSRINADPRLCYLSELAHERQDSGQTNNWGDVRFPNQHPLGTSVSFARGRDHDCQ
jgi:hypothetical protein